jgi:hypothetical protein
MTSDKLHRSISTLSLGEVREELQEDIQWIVQVWCFFCSLFNLEYCKNIKRE